LVRVSGERRIFPRRYQANASQLYTLIGLTIGETREFERLDQHAADERSGNDAWNFDDEPTTREDKRWCEPYSKHEVGWSVWYAAEAGLIPSVPVPHRRSGAA
jgi:hypothetical protein